MISYLRCIELRLSPGSDLPKAMFHPRAALKGRYEKLIPRRIKRCRQSHRPQTSQELHRLEFLQDQCCLDSNLPQREVLRVSNVPYRFPRHNDIPSARKDHIVNNLMVTDPAHIFEL
jgi:hypothetical protein